MQCVKGKKIKTVLSFQLSKYQTNIKGHHQDDQNTAMHSHDDVYLLGLYALQ